MAITMKQVRDALNATEPDYDKAKKLGRGAMPFLLQLVNRKDAALASKASYLASIIGGNDAIKILEKASHHPSATTRITVAECCKKFKGKEIEDILITLMKDKNSTVSFIAIKSSRSFKRRSLIRKEIASLISSRKKDFIRKEARKILRKSNLKFTL